MPWFKFVGVMTDWRVLNTNSRSQILVSKIPGVTKSRKAVFMKQYSGLGCKRDLELFEIDGRVIGFLTYDGMNSSTGLEWFLCLLIGQLLDSSIEIWRLKVSKRILGSGSCIIQRC